jgi:uncharacterized protein YjbI with pentapeptide repeats
MKKILFAVLHLFLFSNAYAHVNYIPSQLDQFQKTGICEGCDLSEANLESRTNADLRGALLVKSSFRWGSFYSSDFTSAKMMYSKAESASFSGSKFVGTDLTGASLSYGNFTSCDFTDANLEGADLSHADLAWAALTPAQLAQAKTLSCAILPDGTRHAPDRDSSC